MVPVRSRVHGAVKGAVPSSVDVKGNLPSSVEMKGTVPSSVDTVVGLFEEYVEAMEERKMKMWGCRGRVRSRLKELEAITRKCSEDQEAITSRFILQLQEKGITSSTLDSVVTSLHWSVSFNKRNHKQPLHNRGDGSIRNTANRRRDQIVRHVAFHHFALIHREEETLNGRPVLLHGKCRVLEGDSGLDGSLMKRCME